MEEPKMGDKAICSMCGAEIEYIGPYWRHTGAIQPRHPATPATKQDLNKLQHWMDTLDPREQAQVRHAIEYAERHISAGAPGHGQFVLIAKLARQLDEREQAITFAKGKPVIQKISWSESDRCWRDVMTGVRVDVP